MDALRRNLGVATGSLLASSATLICCVLPAVMVSLGAGAAMVGLVTTFPQLVWLSEHKVGVFLVAAGFLIASGLFMLNARNLPCPADPKAARTCTKLRRISLALFIASALSLATGAIFAFVL